MNAKYHQKKMEEFTQEQIQVLSQLVPQNQELSDNAFAEILNLILALQQQNDEAIAELSCIIGGQ